MIKIMIINDNDDNDDDDNDDDDDDDGGDDYGDDGDGDALQSGGLLMKITAG